MESTGQTRDHASTRRRRPHRSCLLLAVLLLVPAAPASAGLYGPYADYESANAACSNEWNTTDYRWTNGRNFHWLSWNWCDDPGRFYHPPEPALRAVGINVAFAPLLAPGLDSRPRYLYYIDGCPEGETAGPDGLCRPDDAYAQALNAGDPATCTVDMAAGSNPIHVGTGNKYQREVDIADWSPFAAPLVRHYNSRPPGADGRHWRHTWQRRLAVDGFAYRDDAGEVHTVDDTLALVRPDGRTLVFHRTGAHELAERAANTPADIPAVGTAQYPLHWTGSEWRYRNERGALEFYDADGRLRRIVDRRGFTQTVERDADGRIAAVRDDFGRRLTFHYDTAGRLARVDDPAGRSYGYDYDAESRLVSVTDPDGATRRYHYGEAGAPAGHLTGITDANGARFATWTYDDRGRAIVSEHAGGAERVEIDYVDDDTVRVTDAGGAERTYDVTTVRGRRLATAIDGDACSRCGQAANYEYDDRGLVTRMTDRNGNVTTYQYDAAGLEAQRTEAAGTAAERTITTEWDTDLRLPRAVNEPGRRTEYGYDGRGRVVTETVIDTATGARRTTTYSYHPDANGVPGRLASIDGPRTDVDDITRFAYDADGDRVRVTNALGHVTAITAHDAYGRPTAIVGPNGRTTTLAYDAAGRLVERDAGGRVTRFAYDAAGNLARVTRPDGSFLAYAYDAAQRVIAIENEQGHRIDYTLDARGGRTAELVSNASGVVVREHRRAFDALGRLVRTIGAQGQTTLYAYDANGNRTGITDPAGDATGRAFDALDRLVRQTDALGGVTRSDYDAHDRITAVTDPNGNTTRYTYDGLGNRVRVDSPDAGITTYDYDAAGNVIERTDARGKTTTYSYDALDRRTSATHANGTTVTYEWDTAANGIGRLARIVEPSGTTAWEYNLHGDVVERRQVAAGVTLATTHAYDAAGRRTATTRPSGTRVTYSHDAGRVTAIAVDGTPVLAGIRYAPFGPVAGWTWGDGDPHARQFDQDGRLVAHGMPDGQRDLTYSVDGRITGIRDPNVDNGYGYDALDRLTEAGGVDWTRSYVYDANGNRLARTADGAITDYTLAADSNRLLAAAGAQNADYAYDAAGNTIADGEHRYTYDARGRLAAVDGGDTAVYRYNALGQRVYKRRIRPLPDQAAPAARQNRRGGRLRGDNGIERRFAYDEQGRLTGVYDARGTRVQEYVYLGRLPVAVIDRRGIHYIHTDHLGTPRAVSEPGGSVIWQWISDPFGHSASNENPDGNDKIFTLNLRFPGQYFDQETGTHYNLWRAYDPSVGRYTTSDPFGLLAGNNPYSYVANDPVWHLDPHGLVKWEASYAGGGLFIGVGAGVHHFSMTSECIDGKQASATVLFIGPGMGASIGYTVVPVSVEEDLVFHDSKITPDPMVFDGMGGMAAFAAELAPASYGIREITLGIAKYDAGSGNGATGGIEVGGFIMTGSSNVLSAEVTDCDCDD